MDADCQKVFQLYNMIYKVILLQNMLVRIKLVLKQILIIGVFVHAAGVNMFILEAISGDIKILIY